MLVIIFWAQNISLKTYLIGSQLVNAVITQHVFKTLSDLFILYILTLFSHSVRVNLVNTEIFL